jgi:transposase
VRKPSSITSTWGKTLYGSADTSCQLLHRKLNDPAKQVFQLHGVDAQGNVVLHKRVTRKQLLPLLAQLPPCLVGLEACGGSHYWAREITKLGHTVKLMAPQAVKPYVQGNKTDGRDAEGICEAATRPRVRAVAINSVADQDMQTLHRVREHCVKVRTALANQLRGVLGEYGFVVPQGIGCVRKAIPLIVENAENELSALCRELLWDVYQRMCTLDAEVTHYNARIAQLAAQSEVCQRLTAVAGVGPLTTTAFVAAVHDLGAFKNGRHCTAWLGPVPTQHGTGGKTVLGGMSKRGNQYPRRLLLQGAIAVLRRVEGKMDPRSTWLQQLRARRGTQVAAGALTNKNARILWALLATGEVYRQAA